jgi:hypothetical protein
MQQFSRAAKLRMLRPRGDRKKKAGRIRRPRQSAFRKKASKLPPATVSFVDPNQTTV